MTVPGGQTRGVVYFAGEPFFLENDPQSGAPLWEPRWTNTKDGDPTRPQHFEWHDWSRGLGDSRGVFPGAIESCLNAWVGSMGRILPGPKINVLGIVFEGSPCTTIVTVTLPSPVVIALGGRYAVEVNPTTHATAAPHDFGAGKIVTDACLFIDQLAIAMGEATQFQRRDAAGTYAASTVTTDASGDYRYANSFGLSITGDLVRGRSYFWSKCSAADFYGTNGNWTKEYDIGSRARNITRVGSFEGWDFVLKEEGLYTYRQDDSVEGNVLTDLEAFPSTNNKRWFKWGNRLFVCSIAGLYRYLKQGLARPVGIEESPVNETFLKTTRPTAGVGFGEWAYEARYDDATNTTYILMLRNANNGDATLGSPFTSVSIIDSFTGQCLAMAIPALVTATPEVWYGRNLDVAWFKVGLDGKPVDYRDSGTTTVTFSPNDLGNPLTMKYAQRLAIIGRNLSAVRTATIKAAWDGAALAVVGAAITALSASYAEVFFARGIGDSGRVLQVQIELVSNSTSTPPEIRNVYLDHEERPTAVPGGVATLHLEDFASYQGISSQLTAAQQRQFLENLMFGGAFDFTDPDGDTYAAGVNVVPHYLLPVEGPVREQQTDSLGPQDSIRLVVRRLDYTAGG